MVSVMSDPINSPEHYNSHGSGIQCIQITEHFDFLIGNVIKYCWRGGLKENSSKIEDLKKAEYYIKRAIAKEEKLIQRRELDEAFKILSRARDK